MKKLFIIVLSVLISQSVIAKEKLRIVSKGFITEGKRALQGGHLPIAHFSKGITQVLCSRNASREQLNCPPTFNKSHKGFGFTADLPHLRLNIILRRMENKIVSGSGVDSLETFQEPWWKVQISSTAADDSIPSLADGAVGLPLPGPNEVWPITHANVLYQGIIVNGCLASPTAIFDLTLKSSVFRVSTGEDFGEVIMSDTVKRHGDYGFKYTIRATDEEGNVSDFMFTGIADAYCTAQYPL